MLTIAIIGAGPLGRWLALAAARGAFRVRMEDVMPANLLHAQEYLRTELSASALATEEPRIAFVSSIEDAVRDADLVIDCVPDELESKLEILWLIDRMAPPHTAIATPTTHLSLGDLAACTYRADRCVAIEADARALAQGMASSIRIRTTARTSPETIALVRTFWLQIGVEPQFEAEPDPRAEASAARLEPLP